MKLPVSALCLASVAMAALAPILHTFVSIPAIRDTFVSENTASWLAENISGKDLPTIKSEIDSIRARKNLLEDNYLTPESRREIGFYKDEIARLRKNAMLLYCQVICEYVKAVRSDYHPRPLDAGTFSALLSEDHAPADNPATARPSAVLAELLSILSAAEPFEQLVAVVAAGLRIVDREDSAPMGGYEIFGHIRNSDLYICSGQIYMQVPENETQMVHVDTLDMESIDATILIAHSVHDTLYTHSSLYTNEKKKMALLAMLRTVSTAIQK